MSMKMFKIIFTIKVLLISSIVNAEPFVVLEYADKDGQNYESESRNHNDESYSTKHTVKKNETLSNIMQKYYGNKGLNFTFVQAAIIHKNKGAFVRGNPNFMYANKNLYLPSGDQLFLSPDKNGFCRRRDYLLKSLPAKAFLNFLKLLTHLRFLRVGF